MLNLKSAIVATLVVAGTFASSSAFALTGYEIWNGTAWVKSGTANISGATTAKYLGNTVNCTSNFTLTLTYNATTLVQTSQVTNATFVGSGACTSITKVFPWTIGVPTASGTSAALTISGINIHFAVPAQTCTGSAAGVLANANTNPGTVNNTFTFSGTLGACAVRDRTAAADGGLAPLVSDKPIRVY